MSIKHPKGNVHRPASHLLHYHTSNAFLAFHTGYENFLLRLVTTQECHVTRVIYNAKCVCLHQTGRNQCAV